MKKFYDVVVFGAGPAGIAAAITASREGLRVALVELQNKVGGVIASCPGMMFGGGYPCKKSVGGFFEEFVTRLRAKLPPAAERRICSLENFGDEVVYDHEYAVGALCDMLGEANVDMFINHVAQKVWVENGRIVGVDVVNKSQTVRFEGKVFIDCTGDGDVAVKAGVPSQLGNEQGLMMGASLTFFMENVVLDKAFANHEDPYFTTYAERAIQEKKIHKSIPQIYMLKGLRESSVFFNTVTVTGVDGTDSKSMFDATNTARQRVFELAEFIKAEIPGFENSFVSLVGPIVGIRETRHLEGMYTLTYDDIARATQFEDGIVACDNPLDEVFRDESVTHYSHEVALQQGLYYTIPLRSLIPKNITNLFFAGRNMSVDIKAYASIRGMPQCMIMGQSVGLAATESITSVKPVQTIDCSAVIRKLLANGVKGIGGTTL